MKAWLTYFKERFPLPVYVTLVGGFTASGTWIVGGRAITFYGAASFIGLMVFFFLLRLMDEVKDYEKDKIANPTRPLPRGLLDVAFIKLLIAQSVIGMWGYALLLALVFSPQAGFVYLFLSVWLWLMYREFYLGSWLESKPLLYAITHQFVLVPVALLPIVCTDASALFAVQAWQYAGLVVGSFFSYEVCRKLDPKAHPILKTYRSMYGVGGSLAIVVVMSSLAMAMAWNLSLQLLLWPLSIALILSFAFIPMNKHKIVEGIATLSLVAHIWSVVLYRIKELL